MGELIFTNCVSKIPNFKEGIWCERETERQRETKRQRQREADRQADRQTEGTT